MADFKVRYVTTTSANLNSVPIVERQVVHVTNTSPNQLYVDANGQRHNITDKTVIIWGGYRDRSMFGTPNPAMWYFLTGTREFFAWDNAAAAGSIIQAQWNNVPVDAVIARVAAGISVPYATWIALTNFSSSTQNNQRRISFRAPDGWSQTDRVAGIRIAGYIGSTYIQIVGIVSTTRNGILRYSTFSFPGTSGLVVGSDSSVGVVYQGGTSPAVQLSTNPTITELTGHYCYL